MSFSRMNFLPWNAGAFSTAALTLALFCPAEAKIFRNAYVSFELPDRWGCILEQTEWVCRPTQQPQAQQAIVILTAKEVGPSDTLSTYLQHLQTPRSIANRLGQPMRSNVIKVEQKNIGNHPWVDGMHLSSEVPNYYTRYLATVKDKIAVLVTFSAHKLHYTNFNNDFFRAIESLRVIATRSQINGRSGGAAVPGSETFGANPPGQMPFATEDLPEEGSSPSGASQATQIMLGLALILGAAGFYLFARRNRKKK